MEEIVAVILGGGHGTRLFPLTKERAKPAVPLAGQYRLIDIPLSNCINSDIRQIYVLTMFQSASLNSHISSTYRFDAFAKGFVQVLAAEKTLAGGTWFQGTADAVRQSLVHIADTPSRHTLILSGDHLYRMQYREFLDVHHRTGAGATIAVTPVTPDTAREFGLLKIDPSGRVVKFTEKPSTGQSLEEMRSDTALLGLSPEEARKRPFLASMGIYLFDTDLLQAVLAGDASCNDFGKEIIPRLIGTHHVGAFCFNGYWADIGSVSSFYEANIDLTRPVPRFNFFDREMPVYTHPRFLPQAKINKAAVERSLICDGCIIENASVRDSLLGVRTRVGAGATIEESLVMGADFYAQEEGFKRSGAAPGIHSGAHIRRTIIDKNVSVGQNVRLINERNLDHYDDPGGYLFVRDGIIVVAKDAVLPDGFSF